MAAGVLPKPGTQYGPCKRCEHIDCRQTRTDAATLCTFCNKAIGYGKRFVRAQRGTDLAHAVCLETVAEKSSFGGMFSDPRVDRF